MRIERYAELARRNRVHKTTLEIYAEKLISQGVVTEGIVEELQDNWRQHLEAEFEAGQTYLPNKADWLDGRWAGLKPATPALGEARRRGCTGVELAGLKEIGLRLTSVPAGFNLHRTIRRLLDHRRRMIETGEGIDWAMAEALAFAALVDEGYPVRLSGQDSERGTFSQRHSVLIDQETGTRYIPLNAQPRHGRTCPWIDVRCPPAGHDALAVGANDNELLHPPDMGRMTSSPSDLAGASDIR